MPILPFHTNEDDDGVEGEEGPLDVEADASAPVSIDEGEPGAGVNLPPDGYDAPPLPGNEQLVPSPPRRGTPQQRRGRLPAGYDASLFQTSDALRARGPPGGTVTERFKSMARKGFDAWSTLMSEDVRSLRETAAATLGNLGKHATAAATAAYYASTSALGEMGAHIMRPFVVAADSVETELANRLDPVPERVNQRNADFTARRRRRVAPTFEETRDDWVAVNRAQAAAEARINAVDVAFDRRRTELERNARDKATSERDELYAAYRARASREADRKAEEEYREALLATGQELLQDAIMKNPGLALALMRMPTDPLFPEATPEQRWILSHTDLIYEIHHGRERAKERSDASKTAAQHADDMHGLESLMEAYKPVAPRRRVPVGQAKKATRNLLTALSRPGPKSPAARHRGGFVGMGLRENERLGKVLTIC